MDSTDKRSTVHACWLDESFDMGEAIRGVKNGPRLSESGSSVLTVPGLAVLRSGGLGEEETDATARRSATP